MEGRCGFYTTRRTLPTRPRPLGPHLAVYKAQYSSRLSISHRVSGSALGFVLRCVLTVLARRSDWTTLRGSFASAGWFLQVLTFLPSIGYGVLACRRLSLCYHACNGVRHLVWDSGALLSKDTRDRSAYVIRLCAVSLSAALWRTLLL